MRTLWLIAPLPFLLGAAAPPVTIVPVRAEYRPSADEYRRLWDTEGAKMVAALERASGLTFPDHALQLNVYGGGPMAEFGGRTIWLRAGYPLYYQRATLMHELGHVLTFGLPRSEGLDDHRILFLFLYDAWTQVYGEAFAADMAEIESQITGRYDYAGAWRWALAMTPAERRARLQALVEARASAASR